MTGYPADTAERRCLKQNKRCDRLFRQSFHLKHGKSAPAKPGSKPGVQQRANSAPTTPPVKALRIRMISKRTGVEAMTATALRVHQRPMRRRHV
jgi:hypothetical protein